VSTKRRRASEKELTGKIDETHEDLQAIKTSVDKRTKSLLETIKDTREHLHKELGLMIQGEAQMTKTLIDTTRRGLEAKRAEVEARAQRSKGIGTGAGAAKLPKFNRTTSWAVFQNQFETVAEKD
jgi:fumarate hydratase class II